MAKGRDPSGKMGRIAERATDKELEELDSIFSLLADDTDPILAQVIDAVWAS